MRNAIMLKIRVAIARPCPPPTKAISMEHKLIFSAKTSKTPINTIM
jgi:hypothetical protein